MNWRREIEELHAFFERWLRGEAAEGELNRVSRVLSSSFVLIDPEGKSVERDAVLTGLLSARGRRRSLRIRIDSPRLHYHEGLIQVATYEERHQEAERRSVRISTAVLRGRSGTPNGVEWLHLHESWIKTVGPAGGTV